MLPACKNTDAAPVSEFSPGAPTTAAAPKTATELPNWSLAAPSEAVSSVHRPPSCPNTYAAPAPESWPGAPITMGHPSIAIELPKRSFAAPSGAVSVCWQGQPGPFDVNNSAAPAFEFWPGAPTTSHQSPTSSPHNATE